MTARNDLTRRRVLAVISAGSTAAVPGCGGTPTPSHPEGAAGAGPAPTPATTAPPPAAGPGTRVANLRELAPGALVALRDAHVVLGRDDRGVYAMSILCTHQSCRVNVKASGDSLECKCHKSYFDRDGVPTGGPAKRPLPRYEVRVDPAGEITVDKDKNVDAAFRAKA
ncbi:MAG TPA: Rieske (2Fe-2S) protein [Polyangiaceae bacterium]|nr:Rieske (2Fe-2S) protein [Polyangiaceae bacterium]